jgi:hypothetical protein
MAILTLACLGNAALVPFQTTSQVSSSLMTVALALIAAGALVTAIRRNVRIVRQLRSKT